MLDGRWDKHDGKDAANVADLISQGKFLFQEHGQRMRIRNPLVSQYFPELDRYLEKSEAETLAIVKWFLSPSEIAAVEKRIVE